MSRLNTRYESKTIKLEKIRNELIKRFERDYGGSNEFRKLVVTPCVYPDDKLETQGCVLMHLHGSPPKGYALYIFGHNLLIYYSPIGNPWRKYNTRIPELEEISRPFVFPKDEVH